MNFHSTFFDEGKVVFVFVGFGNFFDDIVKCIDKTFLLFTGCISE